MKRWLAALVTTLALIGITGCGAPDNAGPDPRSSGDNAMCQGARNAASYSSDYNIRQEAMDYLADPANGCR